MTEEAIRELVERWEASGRVAKVYPRLRRVSLSGGRSVPYAEAAKRIAACLGLRFIRCDCEWCRDGHTESHDAWIKA